MARLNGGSKRVVREGFDDTKDWPFIKVAELAGKTIPMNGFFITSGGEYGDSCVIVGDNKLINMPARAVKECTELFIAPGDYRQDLIDGKIQLIVEGEVKTKKGKTTSYIIDLMD